MQKANLNNTSIPDSAHAGDGDVIAAAGRFLELHGTWMAQRAEQDDAEWEDGPLSHEIATAADALAVMKPQTYSGWRMLAKAAVTFGGDDFQGAVLRGLAGD